VTCFACRHFEIVVGVDYGEETGWDPGSMECRKGLFPSLGDYAPPEEYQAKVTMAAGCQEFELRESLQ
jgi:hypothetical protein